MRTADLHVQADARAAAEAVAARLKEKAIRRRGSRSNEVASKIAATAETPDPKPYTPTPGTLDPRLVIKELDAAIPKDWDIIVAGGHCFSFAMTHLRGRPAGKYHIPIDFGAIGSGISAAIGVAAARNIGKVMLIDGDGSLYQHIQELETIQRHGIKLLICIINDGGYGAETHKFRAPMASIRCTRPRPRRPRSGSTRLRPERRQGDQPGPARGIIPRTPGARRLHAMGRARR